MRTQLTVVTVVVAQLAERLLPTPEIRRSSPDIDNNLFDFICLSSVSRHREVSSNEGSPNEGSSKYLSSNSIRQ